MITGNSIQNSTANIKRYSANQYAAVYGSTDLAVVMGITSSQNLQVGI
jgi:hypothetical protein